MNRFFKSTTNYKYYSYVNKYSPRLLRQYQSGEHFSLGRRGAWQNLVIKYAGDHINLEEEHNFKYKTHLAFAWLSYRFAWILSIYIVVYNLFLLGDVSQAFTFSDWDYAGRPSPNSEQATRYETMYLYDRPMRY